MSIKSFFFFFPLRFDRKHLATSISEKTTATFGPPVLLSKQEHAHKRKINAYLSFQKLRWAHLSLQKIRVLCSSYVCLLGFSCFVIPYDQPFLSFRVISKEDILCWCSGIFKILLWFEFVLTENSGNHIIYIVVFRHTWWRIFQVKFCLQCSPVPQKQNVFKKHISHAVGGAQWVTEIYQWVACFFKPNHFLPVNRVDHQLRSVSLNLCN